MQYFPIRLFLYFYELVSISSGEVVLYIICGIVAYNFCGNLPDSPWVEVCVQSVEKGDSRCRDHMLRLEQQKKIFHK